MTIPAENHPGHALLALTALPPDEALNAWQAQLLADLNSRRTDGVLIHGGFIGSDLQDHGVEVVLDLLALALASATDRALFENNGDERTRPIGEVMNEQIDDLQLWLIGNLESTLRSRYFPTLIKWEEERRRMDAEEE